MKFKNMTSSMLGVALIMSWTTGAFAADDEVDPVFPQSLVTLPEDRSGPMTEAVVTTTSLSAAGVVMDEMIDIHEQALNDVEASDEFKAASERALRRAKAVGGKSWELKSIALDLAVSAQGALGVLFARGEALVNLYLRRLNDGFDKELPQPPDRDDDARAVSWSRSLSPAELVARIEPLTRTLLATGSVRDETTLRRSLFAAASDFNTLVAGLQPLGARWTPARLRLDFTVEASGMVQPGLMIGGGLKIRFDWFPAPHSVADLSSYTPTDPSPGADSMNQLMVQLADQLGHLEVDDSGTPHGLKLAQAVFSLGLTIAGDFGVAKGSLGAVGYLYLVRHDEIPAGPALAPLGDGTIPLVEGRTDQRHMNYARAHGIHADRVPTKSGGDAGVIYHVPTGRMQAGLDQAATMGRFFAERAARRRDENWRVSQLKTQFALSIGGTVGVVTISGTGAIQLVFNET